MSGSSPAASRKPSKLADRRRLQRAIAGTNINHGQKVDASPKVPDNGDGVEDEGGSSSTRIKTMPQTKLSARKEELRGMSDADLAVTRGRGSQSDLYRESASASASRWRTSRRSALAAKKLLARLTIVNQRKLAAAKGQGS